jgi:hypothetical protein
MKVIIESSFPIREETFTRYFSFPVFSSKIEETLAEQLKFLNQYKTFSLVMKVTK